MQLDEVQNQLVTANICSKENICSERKYIVGVRTICLIRKPELQESKCLFPATNTCVHMYGISIDICVYMYIYLTALQLLCLVNKVSTHCDLSKIVSISLLPKSPFICMHTCYIYIGMCELKI